MKSALYWFSSLGSVTRFSTSSWPTCQELTCFFVGDADDASTVPVANIMCWVCLDGHTPLICPLRDVMSVPLCKVRTLFAEVSFSRPLYAFPAPEQRWQKPRQLQSLSPALSPSFTVHLAIFGNATIFRIKLFLKITSQWIFLRNFAQFLGIWRTMRCSPWTKLRSPSCRRWGSCCSITTGFRMSRREPSPICPLCRHCNYCRFFHYSL